MSASVVLTNGTDIPHHVYLESEGPTTELERFAALLAARKKRRSQDCAVSITADQAERAHRLYDRLRAQAKKV